MNEKETAAYQKKVELLAGAIVHLRAASELLRRINTPADDYRYYASQIDALISSDNGEAGLLPMWEALCGW